MWVPYSVGILQDAEELRRKPGPVIIVVVCNDLV